MEETGDKQSLDSARDALRQAQDHSKGHEQRRTGSRDGEPVEPQATGDKATGDKKGRRVKVDEAEYHTLQDKAKRAEELFDQLLRLQAEFENSRKRHLKEKEEYLRFAHGALVQELLPVYDHFVIALSNIETLSGEEGNHRMILKGVQMIQNEMWELLSRNGLSKIETVGKPFDPEQHEAIETVEDETGPEGTVVEEVRPGYLLNGKLLRPASVKVTKKKE